MSTGGLSSVVVVLSRCGWEIPQLLGSSHTGLLGSSGCLVQPAQHLSDGHFPHDSISCHVRFTQADKKVQCPVLHPNCDLGW